MKVIDLTHNMKSGMMTYPGDPAVVIEEILTHEKDYCHVDHIDCGGHTGTHIDAPYHFIPEGRRITDFPITKFMGRGVVIDLRNKKAGERILPEDIEPKREEIDGALVLLQTGWCEKYGDESYYDHPYLSGEAAALLAELGASIVAVDFLNVDSTLHEDWQAHPALLSKDVLIVENIANSLALDPQKQYRFFFMPMKLQDSDGAPVRAFAIDEDAQPPANGIDLRK